MTPIRAKRAPADEPPPGPRPPQQERGQRRVDAILDAAAALVAEEGAAGVTMHRVARCSGTTIGSMYHFFPDREALLGALAERHARELRVLGAQIERDLAEGAPRSTDEAVGCLLDPFLAYSARHPDFLPLSRLARTPEGGAVRAVDLRPLVTRLAEAVVAARRPDATPAERALRAATMAAIMDGMTTAIARARATPRHEPSVAALRQEMRRALVAYLDSSTE